MGENPILFSTSMVQAILDGRKTQTRRPFKYAEHPAVIGYEPNGPHGWWKGTARSEAVIQQYISTFPLTIKCPFGIVGDRLWVKEKWRIADACEGWSMDDSQPCRGWIDYEAGGDNEVTAPNFDAVEELLPEDWDWDFIVPEYLSSKKMPRWASRILLEITNIRVERLQDITEAGAIAEGMVADDDYCAEEYYSIYWNQKHGWKEKGWNANPWVWVVEFKVIQGGEL
ncbi:hypothetical protein QLH32_05225 [Acinetobacter corruptisaponis]|uniref:Morphogenetic protein n=1 Tax=Acinetobacter corruptisaponis TaxID=3045147 RepID=A0ABY8S708_9GAMM|nr:hypothetical protein [Acinetobacter sp. KCTC 92772]WHP06873.1 hypothetical protein QLH32_05225 [Acinetobacter sp. KCTC 92772]